MVMLPMVEAPQAQSAEAFLSSEAYRATFEAEREAMQRQVNAAEARAMRAETRANNSEATLAQLLASNRARLKDTAPAPEPPAAEPPPYQRYGGTEAPPNSSAQQKREPHADDEWDAIRGRLAAAEARAEMLENQLRGGLLPDNFPRGDGAISPIYSPRACSPSDLAPTTSSSGLGLSPQQQQAADLAAQLVALAVTNPRLSQHHRHRSPSRMGAAQPAHQMLPRAQQTPRMACGRSPPPRNLFYDEQRGPDPLSSGQSTPRAPLPALGHRHLSPSFNMPLQSLFDPKPFTPCGPSGFGPQSPRHARVMK